MPPFSTSLLELKRGLTQRKKQIRATFHNKASSDRKLRLSQTADQDLHLNGNDVILHSPEQNSPSPKLAGDDLWRDAYEKLKQRRPLLIDSFEVIMRTESGTDDFRRSIHETIISQKAASFNNDRWKFRLQNKPIYVRESFNKIVKTISSFKLLMGPISNMDPLHAGLPLAAVYLLLSVSVNPDKFTLQEYQLIQSVCREQ